VDGSGVSSTAFDSQDGILTINTADGQSFTTIIADSNFTNYRARLALSGGTGITYNSATGSIVTNDGQIVHDNLSGFVANEHVDHSGVTITAGKGLLGGGTIVSNRTIDIDSANIRGMFIANKGLSYDSALGTFNIDSANVRGMFSGGTGITYNSGTGEFTTTDGEIVHDNLSGFVANEHIDHSGVTITAGKGLTGGGTIASSRTIDVDSANLVTLARNALSGANGISYTSGTGVIRAAQPLDSSANPTFNQLRGPSVFIIDPAAIGDATGTVRILGDLTVDGETTTINSTAITLNDKNIVIADSAADSSALSSGGITWGGSNIVFRPSFVYNHGTAAFDVNRNITSTGQVAGATLSGTLATAAQPNITSLGTLTDLNVDSARITTLSIPQSGQIQVNADQTTIGGLGSNILANAALYIRDDNNARLGFDANEITSSGSLFLNAGTSGADVQISSNTEVMILAKGNEGVGLYYDNAEKFTTTDSGVNITGDIRLGNVALTSSGIIDSARLPAGTFGGGGGGGSGNLDSALAIDLLTKNNLTLGQDVTFDSANALFFDQSQKRLEVNSSAASIHFEDNARATFGSSQDAHVRHTGSQFQIYNYTGSELRIRTEVNDGDIKLQADDGSGGIATYVHVDGGTGEVDLNHYGSTKLTTKSDGVDITGNLDVTSSDSSQGILVTGPRLGITTADSSRMLALHVNNSNGSQLRFTEIRDGAGATWTTAQTRIQKIIDTTKMGYIQFNGADNNYGMELGTQGDEKFLRMVRNGAVEVYHDDNKKLETAEGGVTVTGTINADSATFTNVTGTLQTAAQTNVTSLGTLTGLTVGGDVTFDSAGAILFDKSDQALEVNAATHSINLVDHARINLGSSQDGVIQHTGTNLQIFEQTGNLQFTCFANDKDVDILTDDGSGGTTHYFKADGSTGDAILYHYGSEKLKTQSTGVTVTGLLSATTKSFDIEHPTKEGMRLRYGSLEGPENGVYVRGRATSSIIELPEHWTGLVDEDTITVELTPIGKHQKLYVEDIADNKIMIGNDNLINKKINCFYIVYGERKDVDKITVEY
jgi:hypothetical protein